METIIDDEIRRIETKATEMIRHLVQDRDKIRERIKAAENQLLEQIRMNPKVWNHEHMNYNIKQSKAVFVVPSIDLESQTMDVLESFCERELPGPISPEDWRTVFSNIKCSSHFQISFECKKKSKGHLAYCRIGTWFGLSINSKKAGTYEVRLKQANGLFKDNNQYPTDSKDHYLNNKDWNKEFSRYKF